MLALKNRNGDSDFKDTRKETKETKSKKKAMSLAEFLLIVFVSLILFAIGAELRNIPASVPPPVAQYNNSPTLNPDKDLKLAKGWGWTTNNYGDEYIEGRVINQSDNTYSTVIIRFNLYDKDYNLVGNTNDLIDNLGPHETWKFKAPVPYNNAHTAEFVGIDGF